MFTINMRLSQDRYYFYFIDKAVKHERLGDLSKFTRASEDRAGKEPSALVSSCRFFVCLFVFFVSFFTNTCAWTQTQKLRCKSALPSLSQFSLVSLVAQSCLTLCDPRGCSMPGFPVHHQLPELTQTHVHRVSDVIQPSHPLSSPSSPTFNLSQDQGLF